MRKEEEWKGGDQGGREQRRTSGTKQRTLAPERRKEPTSSTLSSSAPTKETAAAADDMARRGVVVLCSRRRRPEAERKQQGSGSSEQAKWAGGHEDVTVGDFLFFAGRFVSPVGGVPVPKDDKKPPGFWSGSRKCEVTGIARGVPCKWACLSDILIPRCLCEQCFSPAAIRRSTEEIVRCRRKSEPFVPD